MSNFPEHYSDRLVIYPISSLMAFAIVYTFTKSGVIVIGTVIIGYIFLTLGILIPDIDNKHAIIHKYIDKSVLTGTALLMIYWMVFGIPVEAGGLSIEGEILLQDIPDRLILVLLAAFLLIWKGITSHHRTVTHHVTWGLGMTVVIVLGTLFGLVGWDWVDRGAVATGLAIHFLIGVIAHLDRDGLLFGDEFRLDILNSLFR